MKRMNYLINGFAALAFLFLFHNALVKLIMLGGCLLLPLPEMQMPLLV